MYKKITVAAFLVSLLAFFTFTFILPRDKRASELENRPLAEMPEFSPHALFSGKFGTLYEEFLSDNVGLRSSFTTLGAHLEKLLGFSTDAAGQLVTLTNGSTLALHGGKIMEIFKQNPPARDKYISTINKYAEILPEQTDMYVMLVPTQIEFSSCEYAVLSDSQYDTISEIYNSLNNVTAVNVYDTLKEHSSEYIYFRTDHHWTQRGAYLGYAELIKSVGDEPIPLANMDANKQSVFLGYLYNQANVPEYSRYADDIEFFVPDKNYTVSAKAFENGEFIEYSARIISPSDDTRAPAYAIFMGGDHPFAKIDTDKKNGNTALIIKDSYANALIPFLTRHYETLLVIDPRSYYGTVTELLSEYSVDDIFFINYAFSSTLEGYIDALDKIR